MTTWHQRLLPYPLLAPWTEDYGGASFRVDVPEAVLSNGRQVKVSLAFHLDSDTLRSLIQERQGQVCSGGLLPKDVRTEHPRCTWAG